MSKYFNVVNRRDLPSDTVHIGGSIRKYPFNELDCGQGFYVPRYSFGSMIVEGTKYTSRVQAAAYAYAKKYGVKLSVRKLSCGGYRVERIK